MSSKKFLSFVGILALTFSSYVWSDENGQDDYDGLKNLFMQEAKRPFSSFMPEWPDYEINLSGKCFRKSIFSEFPLPKETNYTITIHSFDGVLFTIVRSLIHSLLTDTYDSPFFIFSRDDAESTSDVDVIAKSATNLIINFITAANTGTRYVYKWIEIDGEYITC